jgi:hypothetical protein
MSAALTLELSDLLMQESIQSCRFCNCTEDAPCPIYLHYELDGTVRLGRNVDDTNDIAFCSWYLPGVCNSPLCIEKLLEEKRGKVILFDANNVPLKRAEGR